MKRKAFIITALVCCFMISLAAVIADANGKWTGTFKGPDGTDIDLVYTFKIDGDKLTGEGEAQQRKKRLTDAARAVDTGDYRRGGRQYCLVFI